LLNKTTKRENKTVINKAFRRALCGFAVLAVLMAGTVSIFAASNSGKSSSNKSRRPNILLIIGDDI